MTPDNGRSLRSLPGDRLRSKIEVFGKFVENLAQLSTCKRLKVGCAIITPNFNEVVAIGYNGPPTRYPNDACRGEPGNCGCVHAEANALVKLRARSPGLVLWTSYSPCEHCAGLILNAGVGSVIYMGNYRDPTGLEKVRRVNLAAVSYWDLLGRLNPDAKMMAGCTQDVPPGTGTPGKRIVLKGPETPVFAPSDRGSPPGRPETRPEGIGAEKRS
jgi:deoxycytidylate deaminase